MERITAKFMAAVLAASCFACTTNSGDAGISSRKVADQRLAAYSPIRRLTYLNACGSEGPLTVCVDRITLSDSAALVEARIRNTSPQVYIQENMNEASVILADDAGKSLAWDNKESREYQGAEEKVLRFRMEGHFSGEPTILMMNNIRRKNLGRPDQGVSIAARLGE
jgi:hypothetical protein